MVNQELYTSGDKTIAKIGTFNIEVTNEGKDIKVFSRKLIGKKLIFKEENGGM